MNDIKELPESHNTERSSTILVLTALTTLLLVVLGGTILHGYIVDARNDELALETVSHADYINSLVDRMEKKATELAVNGETFYQLSHTYPGNNYDTIIADFLTRSFSGFTDALGGGIWYEPYRFYPDHKYYGPYAFWQDSHVQFTWDLSSRKYDYFKWPWYTMALPEHWDRNTSRPKNYYWSQPYQDGAGSGALMVTVDTFMHDHDTGEIIGVTTVDWALDSMLKLLEKQPVTPHSHSFLIDHNSNLILSLTLAPDMRMQHIKAVPWLSRLVDSNSGNPRRTSVEVNGIGYSVFHVTTHNDMVFGVMVPTDEISGNTSLLIIGEGVVALFLILLSLAIYKLVVDRLHRTVALRTEELVIAKEAAEASARAKSRFLANMSHEIRTPFNGVSGFVNLLTKTELNHVQREYLYTIRRSLDALMTIINDILDFSRIESGKLLIRSQRFDLHPVIADIVKLFSTSAQSKGVTLKTEYQLPIPYVIRGDAVRLTQLLSNLLSNAVKFTDQGEVLMRISHAAQHDSNDLVFEVIDSGRGVDPELASHLFEAFEQAHSDDTHTGTGLGLAICKGLIDAMHGSIGFESLATGTRFWVRLPLPHDNEADKVPFAAERSSHERLRGKKVLVVDDVVINRKLITSILNQWEIHYSEANDGAEAIAKSEDEEFDLILMDIRMPVMDGLMATRAIRQREDGFKHTPIIGLTAHAFPHEQEEFIKAGMDASLTKPINEEQLTNVMLEFFK